MAAVASATLRGSSCRRFSSPLDSPMDLQGRWAGPECQQVHNVHTGLADWLADWLADSVLFLLPAMMPTEPSRSSPPIHPPEVLHQLHRVAVVHLDLVHIDRRDAQPRPRQQVAGIPHLAEGRAGWQGRMAGQGWGGPGR